MNPDMDNRSANRAEERSKDDLQPAWRAVSRTVQVELWSVIVESWSNFWRALPLLFFWLFIPLALLVTGSIYQAYGPSWDLQAIGLNTIRMEIKDPARGPAQVILAYPALVRRDGPMTPGAPLAVWMRPITTTVTPTFTPIATPTFTPTSASTSALVTSTAATPTPSPSPTASVTPPLPLLIIEPSGLTLIDAHGQPASRQVALDPSWLQTTPGLFYLRPNLLPDSTLLAAGALSLSVNGAVGQPPPTRLPVNIESDFSARWRAFLAQLFATPVLLGALITAMAGFAVQQWNNMNQTRHQREQELRDVMKEIDQMSELSQEDWSGFADRYLQLKKRGRK
jgi:hypothetical protein